MNSYINKKIKILAPSSGLQFQDIDYFFEHLSRLPFKYEINNDIFAKSALPFYSNSLEYRMNDLVTALGDPDIGIIWSVRGGYGCSELIQELKIDKSKILIGFSDFTSLHNFVNYHDVASIHAKGIYELVKNSYCVDYAKKLLDICYGITKTLQYDLKPINDYKITEDISGNIVGGNLTIYTTCIGTKFSPKTDGKILFLEDVNERGYKIMRSLQHLKQSNLLNNVRAIIFGDFLGGDEPNGLNHVKDTINFFASSLSGYIPCFSVENIGHGYINEPIIFSADSIIKENKLTIKNPFK